MQNKFKQILQIYIRIVNQFLFIHSVEIHIRLPEKVTSKNLKVNITNTSIDVYCVLSNTRNDILNGQLSEKCKAMDVMWTITGGNKLNISIGNKHFTTI